MLVADFAVGELAVGFGVHGALCPILLASHFVMPEHRCAVIVFETVVTDVASSIVPVVLMVDERAEVLDPYVVQLGFLFIGEVEEIDVSCARVFCKSDGKDGMMFPAFAEPVPIEV